MRYCDDCGAPAEERPLTRGKCCICNKLEAEMKVRIVETGQKPYAVLEDESGYPIAQGSVDVITRLSKRKDRKKCPHCGDADVQYVLRGNCRNCGYDDDELFSVPDPEKAQV